MLKPISQPFCCAALAACQQLMRRFALWLCDPAMTPASVTQAGLQPPVLASAIEADWLWSFLQQVKNGNALVGHAESLVAMPVLEKKELSAWVNAVSALPAQFNPGPSPWPINRPVIGNTAWRAFRALMEAFYDKAFKSTGGLPFMADGTPTNAGGVTYAAFVKAFREAHRLNSDPTAREVCVLCGGPLGDTPHVDHWIIKSAFPLLSMCADNMVLICGTCNEAPNKGEKRVHNAGGFADWFHPYLRPGNGALQLDYVLSELAVRCSAAAPEDQAKAANLDTLLNLSSRWTREFKAEYAKQQNVLIRREQRQIEDAQARHTQADIKSYVQQWRADLAPSEPHYEIHQILAAALQEPSRLAAWHSELGLVP